MSFSSVSISYNDLTVLLHMKQISLGARLLITLACVLIYNIAKCVKKVTSDLLGNDEVGLLTVARFRGEDGKGENLCKMLYR